MDMMGNLTGEKDKEGLCNALFAFLEAWILEMMRNYWRIEDNSSDLKNHCDSCINVEEDTAVNK